MKNTPLQVVVEFQNKLIHNVLKLCCFILKRNVISSCSRQETPPASHRNTGRSRRRRNISSLPMVLQKQILPTWLSLNTPRSICSHCWRKAGNGIRFVHELEKYIDDAPSNLNPISECFVKSGFHHGLLRQFSLQIYIYVYPSQATRPRISGLVEKKQFFFKFLDYFGFLRSSPGIYGLVRVFTVKSGFRLFFSQLVSDNVCFPTLWKEHLRHFPNSSPSQRNMFPVYSRVIS